MAGILAVIPARGGSTRIPRKNLQAIGGRTLVQIAVDDACGSGCMDRVVVSTDDPDIGDSASGAIWVRRPAELSTADADIAAATRHALLEVEHSYGETFDWVATLQPACPCRPAGAIARLIDAVEQNGCQGGVTVVAARPWLWRRGARGWTCEGQSAPGRYIRSQDAAPIFAEVNAIQVSSREAVLAGERWRLPMLLLELDEACAIDIDVPADLIRARALWEVLSSGMFGVAAEHVVQDVAACDTMSAAAASRHDADLLRDIASDVHDFRQFITHHADIERRLLDLSAPQKRQEGE